MWKWKNKKKQTIQKLISLKHYKQSMLERQGMGAVFRVFER